MEIAHLVKRRATCLRRQVGAVLVKDKNILATGYNGTPSGIQHCLDRGCLREQMGIPSGERHEICRGLHAEQNAIIQAAKHGTNIDGATLYCTNQPCGICAKMIINAGVKHIIFRGRLSRHPCGRDAERVGHQDHAVQETVRHNSKCRQSAKRSQVHRER